ncbi:hypothetical protein A33Q_1720 [Indibacter alkaliphilus LW1]|uniref:Uncharacterized protein n=1 Tax=Indibacter alkaliphilus (strain CCUG 57479 / KCTC 22604 / LW1) TaxID=1189612 RepID=S2DF60_INDAL|nr:hypothetical protein A33Q_1720 [Indibacter alkaliphilus LW1]
MAKTVPLSSSARIFPDVPFRIMDEELKLTRKNSFHAGP